MKYLYSLKNYMTQRFESNNDLKQSADNKIDIDFDSSCTKVPCLKISCYEIKPASNIEQLEISSCKFKLTYIHDSQTDEMLQSIENQIRKYMDDAPQHLNSLQGVIFLHSGVKYTDSTISIEYNYKLLF